MGTDRLDIKILELLMGAETLSPKLSKIAMAVGSTNATVYRRIEAMKKDGIIIGYTTVVDKKLIGKPLQSLIYLKISRVAGTGEREEVSRKISDMADVESAFVPLANWDYIMIARHSDIEALDRFIKDKISALPIDEMRIEILTKAIKL
jgi:DNA-binding Lrp family transcriptional regulator